MKEEMEDTGMQNRNADNTRTDCKNFLSQYAK